MERQQESKLVSGSTLRKLFSGYASGSSDVFFSAAREAIESERSKNNRLLADDLEAILRKGRLGSKGNFFEDIPTDRDNGLPLLSIERHDYTLDRIVASSIVREEVGQVIKEYQREDLLESFGISPKRKLLFCGPPGCGKTLTARVLASELDRSLAIVRLDVLVSSLLGETASNIRKLFDFLDSGNWVVLFDEFDAIGTDRSRERDQGELRRVVNSILQLMDDYRGRSLLIAATNHESMLDEAIWRRFDGVFAFRLPSVQDRKIMLRMFMGGVDHQGVDTDRIAERSLGGASGSDVERVAVESMRRAAVEGRRTVNVQDFKYALNDYRQRRLLVNSIE
jgi:SpoVK/Ycf46/Vps4 family AAA+-type ATPase